MNHLQANVEAAAQFLRDRLDVQPKFGIILGTGSNLVASEIEADNVFDYQQIPNFPVSTALGHKGRLVIGKFDAQPVVAMDGRFHLYEGHSVDDATLGVRVMQALGVDVLFVTNAAGGLNPKYQSGDIMVIDSFIDLMFRCSPDSSNPVRNQRPTHRVTPGDSELAEIARVCGRANDFPVQTGVYAAMLGPNYETRAEYRMLRRIGADVAGMSTVPEIYVANQLGLQILALSIVTNVAKPDVLDVTSGQEVVDAANSAAPRIATILKEVLGHLN